MIDPDTQRALERLAEEGFAVQATQSPLVYLVRRANRPEAADPDAVAAAALDPLRRRCARCMASFITTHPEASLAACFCPECQHMVPEGWED